MNKGKIAFVFPGQGAQKVGMGRDLLENFPGVAEIMELAGKTLGFDLASLCMDGPEERLSETENTQPALLTVSAIALKAFREKCSVIPDFVAGHSLGEFSALYAAGVYSLENAVRIVRKRGEYMSQVSGGAMAAVLGLDTSSIEKVCADISSASSELQPANYNGEGQTVIAGNEEAIERAIPILNDKGAKRVVKLNVSAAFHTPFMNEAAKKLALDLDGLEMKDPDTPLVNNVDSKIVNTADEARDGLKRQVTGAVLWTGVMRTLIGSGVRTVIEFGVGRTLIGMFRKMDKTLNLLHVEDRDSLNRTVEAIQKE